MCAFPPHAPARRVADRGRETDDQRYCQLWRRRRPTEGRATTRPANRYRLPIAMAPAAARAICRLPTPCLPTTAAAAFDSGLGRGGGPEHRAGGANLKRGALLTTHRSPLAVHCSLPTARRSLLTTHRSLPTAHYPPLTAHRSPLAAHRPPLTAHRTLLSAHRRSRS